MTTRATAKTLIRNLLGTTVDDPLYGDSTPGVSPLLDPILQQVVDALVGEIHQANEGFLSKSVTLTPDSPSSRLYTFATQAAPITDFAKWLEVRFTDSDGAELEEVRLDELHDAGADFFTITGADESAVLQASPDTGAGGNLWMRYAYWPADMVNDASLILGVPQKFHDVVELESLFVFGIGGESRWPDELRERWTNRRAALFAHVTKRGRQPARTRLDRGAGSYLG